MKKVSTIVEMRQQVSQLHLDHSFGSLVRCVGVLSGGASVSACEPWVSAPIDLTFVQLHQEFQRLHNGKHADVLDANFDITAAEPLTCAMCPWLDYSLLCADGGHRKIVLQRHGVTRHMCNVYMCLTREQYFDHISKINDNKKWSPAERFSHGYRSGKQPFAGIVQILQQHGFSVPLTSTSRVPADEKHKTFNKHSPLCIVYTKFGREVFDLVVSTVKGLSHDGKSVSDGAASYPFLIGLALWLTGREKCGRAANDVIKLARRAGVTPRAILMKAQSQCQADMLRSDKHNNIGGSSVARYVGVVLTGILNQE